MTFSKEKMKHLNLDHNDDWQMDEDTKTVSVMFNGLEPYICQFFDIDLDNQYPDGWIDSYASIDVAEKTVISLYFHFESNAGDESDRELELKITNYPEQVALYAALSDQELDDFVAEAYSMMYESQPDVKPVTIDSLKADKLQISDLFQAVRTASLNGYMPMFFCNGEYTEIEYPESGTYPAEMEIPTAAGVMRAYRSADPGQPGISVVFQPAGYEEEIDLAYTSVYEDESYQTEDKERPVDVVIMAYGDPYNEDYTSKDILRREDVMSALSDFMLSPSQVADNWRKIVLIFDESRDKGENPAETAKTIVSTLGKEAAIETFAVISQIKKHDGRIYGENREFMDNIPVNPDAIVWDNVNPVIRAGVDLIHTTHINQLITELRK